MIIRFLSLTLLFGFCHGLTIMPPMTKTADHLPLAKQAMEYFDKSPDPFHAVQTSIDMLVQAGFEELEDVTPYAGKIQPGTNERMMLSTRHDLCCGPLTI
jgi:hypothetical protein